MIRKSNRAALGLDHLESRDTPAAVGALDPSLGGTGKLLNGFGGDDRGAAVAVQADGKLVIAGSSDTDFAIARYNPDGSPDTAFSGDGRLTISLGGVDRGAALAVQADGKIVVAGYTSAGGTATNANNFAVVRFNADGSLDTNFGTGGISTIDFGADDRAAGVVVQADGRIVVAGSRGAIGTTNFAAARLNSAGALDNTFGTGGLVAVSIRGFDAATAVALQADGKIVLAGSSTPFTPTATTDFAAVRLTTAGALDTTFDGDGKALVDFGGTDMAAALAVQTDGKLVLAGSTPSNFAVARLNSDGGLDTSFDGDGRATFNLGSVDAASGVVVQPDGKIVVAGTSGLAGTGDFAVIRLTTTGSPDASFNLTGEQRIDFGGDDTAAGVTLTNSGRILVAGSQVVAGSGDFAAARLIGGVELGHKLAEGGSLNAAATVYAPAPNTAGYNPTPAATASAFTGLTTNARAAVADVNGDGVEDTILVTGPGTPIRVSVVSGVDNKTLLVQPFDPFTGNFTGGGYAVAADFDGDGKAEIVVTPDRGGGPRVVVFSIVDGAAVQKGSFFGITDDPAFRGGARAGAGDVNGDGVPDIVVSAGFGGGPRIAAFDGRTVFSGAPAKLTGDFFAFESVLRNGAYVAVGDIDGDGFGDLLFGAGTGGAPRLLAISGKLLLTSGAPTALGSPVLNFFVAGDTTSRGGIRVTAKDVDGDNKADVVVGAGEGVPSRSRVYPGFIFKGTGEPTESQTLDPFGQVFTDGIYVG